MTGTLEFQELEDHLNKITYKPSWRFRLEPHWGSRDLFLSISFRTLDTYTSDIGVTFDEPSEIETRAQVKIGMRHRLRGPFLAIEQFERAVLDAIDKCERHETREWFKVDSVMKFDPHKGMANS